MARFLKCRGPERPRKPFTRFPIYTESEFSSPTSLPLSHPFRSTSPFPPPISHARYMPPVSLPSDGSGGGPSHKIWTHEGEARRRGGAEAELLGTEAATLLLRRRAGSTGMARRRLCAPPVRRLLRSAQLPRGDDCSFSSCMFLLPLLGPTDVAVRTACNRRWRHALDGLDGPI